MFCKKVIARVHIKLNNFFFYQESPCRHVLGETAHNITQHFVEVLVELLPLMEFLCEKCFI